MELTQSNGRLVAVGGAEDRTGEMRILQKFVEICGGKSAEIVVMTIATDEAESAAKELTRVFKKLKVKSVKTFDVASRADTESKRGLKLIEQASGLFFTGGDQIRITSLLGGTEMQRLIHKRFEKNLVIGGTSAGAAMMSNSMILEGDGEANPRLRAVEIGPGMDLIIGAMIDVHFSERGRHGRLLSAVAHYPQDLGLGVDEDTAMLIDKGEFEVIGSGAVTIIDGGAMTYTNASDIGRGENLALADVRVHVLPEGYKFNLHDRCVIIPKKKPAKSKRANAKNK